jgi:dGTPase
VHDLVEHSERAGDIAQGERVGGAMSRLRKFMFDRVYLADPSRQEAHRVSVVIEALLDHYLAHPEELPSAAPGADDLEARVTDYLAGMTDRFAIRDFERLSVPRDFS